MSSESLQRLVWDWTGVSPQNGYVALARFQTNGPLESSPKGRCPMVQPHWFVDAPILYLVGVSSPYRGENRYVHGKTQTRMKIYQTKQEMKGRPLVPSSPVGYPQLGRVSPMFSRCRCASKGPQGSDPTPSVPRDSCATGSRPGNQVMDGCGTMSSNGQFKLWRFIGVRQLW